MVKFNTDGFTVEVKGSHPVEDWIGLHNQLADMLSSESPELQTSRYHVTNFLQEMMPDIDLAKKMTE